MTLRADLQDDSDQETTAGLSWRAWLLLPLVLVALVGVVVPLTRSVRRAPRIDRQLEGESEKLVPYRSELKALLGRSDLSALERSVIERLDQRLEEKARERGGRIPESDRDLENARTLLRRYR